jgi:hypothetical protein
MSGAQGANPPGSFTDTTYSSGPVAETHATQHKNDSTDDDKGIPNQFAVDSAPKPDAAAGLGGPVFGGNEGADKGVTGTGTGE